MTLLGSLLKERTIRDNDLWGRWARGDDIDVRDGPGGVRVTRESAMQIAAVWSCVSLISDTIATLPLDTFFRQQGTRKPFRPQPSWVNDPNPEQARPQWVGQQLVALLLDGTAYVYTVRDRKGDVLEAWNVPPWMVTPKRKKRGQIIYEVRDPELGMLELDRMEMFHVPAMSWPGQIKGMSPLEAARNMFGAGLGAQEFAESFYGQGFTASGVLEVPGDLSPDEAKDLKTNWANASHGRRNRNLPAVVTNGAQWKPSQVTPEQAQFLETRAFGRGEIAGFFRVPPHMIGDVDKSTSWGTGIEQQGIGFVTYTLTPWLERLEQAYTSNLMMFNQPAFSKFNTNALMRGDFKARNEAYAIGRNWGWLSADDVNALEDRPPLPNGDGQEYLVPMNMRPAGEPVPPPASPSVPPAPTAPTQPVPPSQEKP